MRHAAHFNLLAGALIGLGGASAALADSGETASADEVRAVVSEMLADAETRSSLLQSGGGAGHDGDKFFLASPDGSFRLNVQGQIQFRYYLNFRDDDDAAMEDDFEPGFQTRRTKLIFSGDVYDDFYYKVQGAFDRDGGSFILEDAYVGYRFDNGMKLQWGQFKTPLLREELVSSTSQLAIDRSPTNEVFNQGRSQGIMASWEAEKWRAAASFSDGLMSANTDFTTDPADWAITGRFEFLFMGEWGVFDDFTSPRGSEMSLMAGAAAHYELGADKNDGLDEPEIFAWTIDVSAEGNGWNAFGAFMGQHVDDEDGVATNTVFADNTNNYGYVIQAGLYLSEDFEVFGRWDHILADENFAGVDSDELKTITAGVNYYLHGHAAKLSADFQWFLDEVGLDIANSGIGMLPSVNDSQFAIRLQFQLLF